LNTTTTDSNISDALQRANNLSKGITTNEVDKLNPQELKELVNNTKKELVNLTDNYKKIQTQSTSTNKLLDTLAQDKSVLELNIEKLNHELKKQYEQNSKIKPLEREIEELRQKVSQTGGATSAELTKYQKECTKLQETVKQLTIEKQELQDSSKVVSDLKEARDRLQAEADDNLMTIALLEEQVSSLKTEVDNAYTQKQDTDVNLILRVEKLQKELDSTTKELKSIKGERDSLSSSLQSAKDDLKNAFSSDASKTIIDKLTKERDQLLKSQTQLTNDLETLQTEKSNFQSNLEKSKAHLNETIAKLKDELSVQKDENSKLHSSFDSQRSERTKTTQENITLKKDYETLLAERNQLKKDLQETQKKSP